MNNRVNKFEFELNSDLYDDLLDVPGYFIKLKIKTTCL